MDMPTYVKESARTAAPNYPLGRELFVNDFQVAVQLMNIIIAANEADAAKRSLFYKTSNEKLAERLSLAGTTMGDVMNTLSDKGIGITNEEFDFIHGALGMVSEVGEMLEEFLKAKAEGRKMDLPNIKEENGDVMWYLAMWMRYFNLSFEDCAEANIAKLRVRFPDKFTEENAHDRNIDKEMEALEGAA